MHGPDGRDHPNESVFAEIEEPRRIVIGHRSNPRYAAEFALTPVSGGTRAAFHHVFESADVRRRIARFAGSANEEYLDRLAELVQACAGRGA